MDKGDFKTFWNFIAISLAFLTLVALVITLAYMIRLAYKFNKRREEEEYTNKHSDLLERFDYTSIGSLNYTSFFLIRRYIITANLVFLWDRKF